MTADIFKTKLRHCISGMAVVGIGSLLTAGLALGSESATATFTDSLVSPGVWQYNVDLADTGTTTVGTFWLGWIPGDNFMPAAPTNVSSPTGWSFKITSGGPSGGSAIRWEAGRSASDLAAGNTLTGFTFDSTLTPAQLGAPSTGHPTDPVDTAFIYMGAPFADPGFQLQATPAPEPTSLALAGLGVLTMVGGALRARRS